MSVAGNEQADATYRWARGLLDQMEQDRVELAAEVERLRDETVAQAVEIERLRDQLAEKEEAT